jgi:hypothetical protein
MAETKPTYIVWDIHEIMTVCTQQELQLLDNIIARVQQLRAQAGKPTTSRFVVVSEEEPHFKTVVSMIDMLKGGNK